MDSYKELTERERDTAISRETAMRETVRNRERDIEVQ